MNRAQVLDTAKEYVTKNRQDVHGRPEDTFERIAALWNAYLNVEWADIQPHDVAAMLALLKIARIAHNPGNDDNWVDAAGYMACGGELCDDHSPEVSERPNPDGITKSYVDAQTSSQRAFLANTELKPVRYGHADASLP